MIVDYCIENKIPFYKNGYIHWWERDKHHNVSLHLFNWAGDMARALEYHPICRKLFYDMFDQQDVSRGNTLPVLIYDFEKSFWKEPPSENEMFLDLCRKRVYTCSKK